GVASCAIAPAHTIAARRTNVMRRARSTYNVDRSLSRDLGRHRRSRPFHQNLYDIPDFTRLERFSQRFHADRPVADMYDHLALLVDVRNRLEIALEQRPPRLHATLQAIPCHGSQRPDRLAIRLGNVHDRLVNLELA